MQKLRILGELRVSGERMASSLLFHVEKRELTSISLLTSCTQMNSRWMRNWNVKYKAETFRKKCIEEDFHDLRVE